MNLELSEDQVALRDTLRRFLLDRAPISTHVRPLLTDPTGTTAAMWRDLTDLGAVGLLVPENYGGAGMTMVEAGVIAEQFGAALHPGPWLSCGVAAVRALCVFCEENAVAEILRGIAGGTTIASFAPGPGVSVTHIQRNGDYVLDGALSGVPDAAASHLLLVLADNRGDSAFLAVDTGSTGLSVDPECGIDQTRKRFHVRFDGVVARPLAFPSRTAVDQVTDDIVITMAADALGAAQAVLDLAVDYAKVRTQFGHRIGSFQAVAHLCVDMYETVELARGGVIHGLWATDRTVDPDERRSAVLRAKAFSGRLTSVGDSAIQVLGGIGYTWEHDAHLYLRRLLSWSAFMGPSDSYLVELGRRLASNSSKLPAN